jgi:hypothetical protein
VKILCGGDCWVLVPPPLEGAWGESVFVANDYERIKKKRRKEKKFWRKPKNIFKKMDYGL